VLIAIGVLLGTMTVAALWFVASLIFRWRFQFSLRCLLGSALIVSMLCSWLAVEMKAAREQESVTHVMDERGVSYEYDFAYQDGVVQAYPYQPDPATPEWLQDLFGIDFFGRVVSVTVKGDAQTKYLLGLPALKELTAEDGVDPLTDAGLANIGKVKSLETVTILCGSIAGDSLKHLKGLTSLRELEIVSERVADEDLKHLAELRTLRALRIRAAKVRGPGLRYIGGLAELEELSLVSSGSSEFGNDGLAWLRALHLKELELDYTQVGDAGLEHLRGMKDLEALSLSFCRVSYTGLACLEGLVNLRRLVLPRTEVTDAGLKSLQGLTKLEVLDLNATMITDAGLPYITRLPNLRYLDVGNTEISDNGLKSLQEATRLEKLGLRRTKVTDDGLKYLTPLRKLQELCVYETAVTSAGQSELSRAMPHRLVFLRSEALSW
jgi:hypothetical protein